MNVRSSTRATSLGSEAHQNELGFFASRVKVPASTSCSTTRSRDSIHLVSTPGTAISRARNPSVGCASAHRQTASRRSMSASLSFSQVGAVAAAASRRTDSSGPNRSRSVALASIASQCAARPAIRAIARIAARHTV